MKIINIDFFMDNLNVVDRHHECLRITLVEFTNIVNLISDTEMCSSKV